MTGAINGTVTDRRSIATLAPAALLSAAVEANVRRTVRDVLGSPEGRARDLGASFATNESGGRS